MTNFKALFATVSTAALLATPLAAQTVPADDDIRSGTPAEQEMEMDQSEVNRVEDPQVAPDQGIGGGNERVGVAQEIDDQTPAGPSEMTIATSESLDAETSGAMLNDSSALIGKWVKSADGAEIGQVKEVYDNANGTTSALVSIDNSLGLDADEFLLNMASAGGADADIMLPQDKDQFVKEVASIAGIEYNEDDAN